ncbi:hypothetical protein ACFL6M_01265 [Candidatus Eisenbacteria bacterium]|uniref:Fibronectin type-III domain-containing protein n=1 Tax=Eiseniibacteriota bacterium TaxID=2212470 RepID=A0ABV6YIQ3_UNCEI
MRHTEQAQNPMIDTHAAMVLGAVGVLLIVLAGFAPTCSAVEWTVPIEIVNGAAESDTITFGVHPEATSGIDPHLGEIELPPWPPSALFECRFLLDGGEGLKLDLRDTTWTARTHSIRWQVGNGGYPVTLRWDRFALPIASLHISDGYGGIFIPPTNMFEVDSLVIPQLWSFITQMTVDVFPGASPGAHPVINPIPDAHVFSGQTFPELSLDDYVNDPDTPHDALQWFVTENQALIFEVDLDRVLHVTVPEGWVGAETVTFTVVDPDGHSADTEATYSVIEGGLPAWTVPLQVRNGAEERRVGMFGIHPEGSDEIDADLGELALPPWPPQGTFDVRLLLPDGFTWSAKDVRGSSPDSILYRLRWQAGDGGYPVTVEWSSDLPLGEFYVQDNLGGTFIPPIDMRTVTQVQIPTEWDFIEGLDIWALAVVDTTPPAGPSDLLVTSSIPGVSASLAWTPCIEEHFSYYEVLFDSIPFDSTVARFVWDWSEDPALQSIGTTGTTVEVPVPAEQYYFRIRAWDVFGNVGETSNLAATGASTPEWPHEDPGSITARPIVLHVWPNPIDARTTIWCAGLDIQQDDGPILSVFDLAGRCVRQWELATGVGGKTETTWRGYDANGQLLASGTYFLRVEAGVRVCMRRVILAR